MSTDHKPDMPPIYGMLFEQIRENSARAVLFHQAIADEYGLNATDHKCLMFLSKGESEGVTAGQLAELTGLTTGAVTSIIDRLEKAGFARREKDPNDRRKVIVRPVPEQVARIGERFRSIQENTFKLLARYSEQELQVILDFLQASNRMSMDEIERIHGKD
ncbi:MarR family transcriptional regulator [Paenibacillus terrigena]|uniref:MarR family winged helix-turn-helix transcriptional regulator n=1 Tax=Paenibacillus terrigena TaxID=369333 RepID=UPI0028D68655|nr:MarR family transcriptional regulator [Paenibacillus terrigena]